MNKQTDKKPIKKMWNKQLRLYNLQPFYTPNSKVVEIITELFKDDLKGKRIIELGAGTGRTIVALAKK